MGPSTHEGPAVRRDAEALADGLPQTGIPSCRALLFRRRLELPRFDPSCVAQLLAPASLLGSRPDPQLPALRREGDRAQPELCAGAGMVSVARSWAGRLSVAFLMTPGPLARRAPSTAASSRSPRRISPGAPAEKDEKRTV